MTYKLNYKHDVCIHNSKIETGNIPCEFKMDPKIFCSIPGGKPGKLGSWPMPIFVGIPAILTPVVGLKVKVEVDVVEVEVN